ncbi:hypothetical protein AB0H43_26770 [Hamadaea sp. NPDC050747]|uniref:CASTOR/POLLUX-related putative ion channel n=1 Tax=Hamadaea sp. NPDC050747 TaxID=3155789 RepID=UPI003403F6BA
MRVTARQRWRYRFDNTMSRGTPALIGLLALASLLLVVSVTGLVMLFAPRDVTDTSDALWRSLLRTLDPGTMGGDQGTAPFLALMLLVTVGGIFIVSSLVGVLSSGLDARLALLRKGKSLVVEQDHTVILGWSPSLFTIVAELEQASGGRDVCVAILADRDKIAMEDEIRTRIGRSARLRVVCRTGNPAAPLDLEIIRPDTAAVVIIPTPDVADPDLQVMKMVLALNHREWSDGRPPVVAAIADSTNLAAARLAGPDVTFVDAEDVTARLIVQSRRHPGLSAVCTDLLGFVGEEIHTRAEPDLTGRTYGEVLTEYATATVFGIRDAAGEVVVNPAPHTLLRDGDELIMLAVSKAHIQRASMPARITAEAIASKPITPEPVDATLILGWNAHGPTILRLLDQYLPAGCAITVAAQRLSADSAALLGQFTSIGVTTVGCDPASRPDLEALSPGHFQHVVVLADDAVDDEHADARTLTTLLHLRDLKQRHGHTYAIVGEISDDANRGLAQVTRADDFVVSTKMISLLLAQLARNHHLAAIFAELFDPEGSDIYLKPAGDYLRTDTPATFATVIEAARRRGQTAIGYRRNDQAHRAPEYGVVLNPDPTILLSFSPEDRVVVLAVN